MQKFRRAIFCFYILKFDESFHKWLILFDGSKIISGLLKKDSFDHEFLAKWVSDLFDKKLDFETVVDILSGDKYADQNKTDIIKLQKEVGKNITELWDTDPIFGKYPHLRTFARNKEFEKMWAEMKQKQK